MDIEEHRKAVEAWRAARDARLRTRKGWLALVGLYWLTPGENHVGAHPSSQVVLHGHDIPPRVGSIWLEDGHARFVPHEGVDLRATVLEDDLAGDPTLLDLGSVCFHLIKRGERFGVRVRDAKAPAMATFKGLNHFPTDTSWRVTARFEPAPAETSIEIEDVTGTRSTDATPGLVAFERDGQAWRIAALPGDDDDQTLWLVFGDGTNGSETYPGGRFLYTEPVAADGTVVADFNLAYNPPCVFSAYATCPLPPPQNRLELRIEAGEKQWHAEGRAG
ncbi:MAG: DUF1684 domain-containing protein [Chloroflexota bacterium]